MSHHKLRFAIVFTGFLFLSACSAPEITHSVEHQEMNKEQIHQGLLSEDMKVKLEAEQQLAKFSHEERLALFQEIRQHGDRSARLLVIEQLGEMPGNPQAREMLEDLQTNDPDRMVKIKARLVLKKFDGPAEASEEAPAEALEEAPAEALEEAPAEAPVPTQPAEDTPTPDAG